MISHILSMIQLALILAQQSLAERMEGLILTMRSGDGNPMAALFLGTISFWMHIQLIFKGKSYLVSVQLETYYLVL